MKNINCLGQGPTPSPIVCDKSQFSCINNGVRECLPNSWKCDGYPDCQDGTDEVGCPTVTDSPKTTPDQNTGKCTEVQVRFYLCYITLN